MVRRKLPLLDIDHNRHSFQGIFPLQKKALNITIDNVPSNGICTIT
jgi:hypothetical protein